MIKGTSRSITSVLGCFIASVDFTGKLLKVQRLRHVNLETGEKISLRISFAEIH